MSPRRQEQKTPTDEELDEFERRKKASSAAPMSSPRYMPSNSRSRAPWSVLSGFAVAGLLLGGVAVSYMTMRSSMPGASAPTAARPEPMSSAPTAARRGRPMSSASKSAQRGSDAPTGAPMTSPTLSATPKNEVQIEEILQRPTRYMGTVVHVKFSSKRMISPYAFVVGDGKSELLVFAVEDDIPNDTPDRDMYVDGEVRDVREVPSDLRRGYKGTVFLRPYRFSTN